MGYVGIRNVPGKVRVLETGVPVAERVDAAELSFDCLRHLDFLQAVDEGDGADFSSTLYWRYLRSTGRTAEAATARCHRFVQLYRAIGAEGFNPVRDPIAVTRDRIRLNGSHRAAIAAFLGFGELEVLVYDWPDDIPGGIAARAEAEVKRSGQTRCVGKLAFDSTTGAHLGRVVFVDTMEGERPDLLVVIEDEQLALNKRREDEVTLRASTGGRA